MSNRKVIQVSSKYTTSGGEEKWRNATVGSAFVRDNGEISLAIDPGISIACLEGVRITIREPFDRDAHQGNQGGQGRPQQQRSNQRAPQQRGHQGNSGWDHGGSDDDIPF